MKTITPVNIEKVYSDLYDRLVEICLRKKDARDYEGEKQAFALIRKSIGVFGPYDEKNFSSDRLEMIEELRTYLCKEEAANG